MQKYVLGQFKMAANKSALGLMRTLHKILVAEKIKPWEIYRRMCDVYGGVCFRQKNVYKWAKHGFANTRRIVHGVEIYWLFNTEKFPDATVCKKVMLTVF